MELSEKELRLMAIKSLTDEIEDAKAMAKDAHDRQDAILAWALIVILVQGGINVILFLK